jgi:hypothetical protein
LVVVAVEIGVDELPIGIGHPDRFVPFQIDHAVSVSILIFNIEMDGFLSWLRRTAAGEEKADQEGGNCEFQRRIGRSSRAVAHTGGKLFREAWLATVDIMRSFRVG